MQRGYRLALLLCLGGLWLTGISVQADPSAREDAETERLKILRAADLVDTLQAQLETHQREMETVKSELAKLNTNLTELRAELGKRKSENTALRSAFDQAESNRAEERKVLLNEISKLVAGTKPKETKPPKESTAHTLPPTPAESDKKEKGYSHSVASGESLWAIVQAYREQGVSVTVDEVRQANNLGKNDSLKQGQKLFIPKK